MSGLSQNDAELCGLGTLLRHVRGGHDMGAIRWRHAPAFLPTPPTGRPGCPTLADSRPVRVFARPRRSGRPNSFPP